MNVDQSLRPLVEKSPKLCSTDAQIVLRDLYEMDYGIYNHAAPGAEHPFQLVMKQWSEDTVTRGLLHERMVQYTDAELGKHFNISFTEMMELPSYVIGMMIEVAENRTRREQPAINEALDALSKASKKPE